MGILFLWWSIVLYLMYTRVTVHDYLLRMYLWEPDDGDDDDVTGTAALFLVVLEKHHDRLSLPSPNVIFRPASAMGHARARHDMQEPTQRDVMRACKREISCTQRRQAQNGSSPTRLAPEADSPSPGTNFAVKPFFGPSLTPCRRQQWGGRDVCSSVHDSLSDQWLTAWLWAFSCRSASPTIARS